MESTTCSFYTAIDTINKVGLILKYFILISIRYALLWKNTFSYKSMYFAQNKPYYTQLVYLYICNMLL